MEGQIQLLGFSKCFSSLISDTPSLTRIACHEIDMGNVSLVFSKSYRCNKIKRCIIDYHVQKTLNEDIIVPENKS